MAMQTPAGGGNQDQPARPTEMELLQRWIDTQDHEAASELYRRYVQRLLHLADAERSQMKSIESAYHDAFGSLLRRAHAMTFHFENDEWLWRLLATIAKRKKIERYRKKKALSGGGLVAEMTALADGEPTTEEVAVYHDLRSRLWAVLNERERIYLEMREKLFNQKEIAAEMGVDPRTVRRLVKDLQLKASRLLCDPASSGEGQDSAEANTGADTSTD